MPDRIRSYYRRGSLPARTASVNNSWLWRSPAPVFLATRRGASRAGRRPWLAAAAENFIEFVRVEIQSDWARRRGIRIIREQVQHAAADRGQYHNGQHHRGDVEIAVRSKDSSNPSAPGEVVPRAVVAGVCCVFSCPRKKCHHGQGKRSKSERDDIFCEGGR